MMSVTIDSSGNKYWKNDKGKLHREDGPAFERANGYKEWRIDGKLHREDGAAIEWASGSKWWWINGEIHRIDGPAIEYCNGYKIWYLNGIKYSEEDFNEKVAEMKNLKDENKPTEIDSKGNKIWRNDKGELHRLDGPAVEGYNGTKEWWINGKPHRIDGPAVEWSSGRKEWYIDGEEYSEEEFNKKIAEINENKPTEVDSDRNKRWLNNKGQYHRLDGPAIEWSNGTKEWFINGKPHRVDGPAAEWANGNKFWYINGKYHREDGPAIEWADGDKEWYLNGERHRIDGPAIEYTNGYKDWYLNGKIYTKESFFENIDKTKGLKEKMFLFKKQPGIEHVLSFVKKCPYNEISLLSNLDYSDLNRKLIPVGSSKEVYGIGVNKKEHPNVKYIYRVILIKYRFSLEIYVLDTDATLNRILDSNFYDLSTNRDLILYKYNLNIFNPRYWSILLSLRNKEKLLLDEKEKQLNSKIVNILPMPSQSDDLRGLLTITEE